MAQNEAVFWPSHVHQRYVHIWSHMCTDTHITDTHRHTQITHIHIHRYTHRSYTHTQRSHRDHTVTHTHRSETMKIICIKTSGKKNTVLGRWLGRWEHLLCNHTHLNLSSQQSCKNLDVATHVCNPVLRREPGRFQELPNQPIWSDLQVMSVFEEGVFIYCICVCVCVHMHTSASTCMSTEINVRHLPQLVPILSFFSESLSANMELTDSLVLTGQ